MQIYRVALTTIGFLFVAVGALALLVPLLPTTPFVLLGAVCLARGTHRHRRWLERLPWLSRYLPSGLRGSQSSAQQTS
jgi:uncharacterized membrane protein YbaN (DUF454 family)